MENKQKDDYEYMTFPIQDADGHFYDAYVDELLDFCMQLGNETREENIEYLNDLIKDIEHYRDSLKD